MYRSLEEALNAKQDIIERIQSIDVQLAERRAKIAVGRVPDKTYQEYVDWKARAMRSKATLTSKLSRTKRTIAEMRKSAALKRFDDVGVEHILDELYGLTKSLIAAGADISPEEQALLDDVQVFLQER